MAEYIDLECLRVFKEKLVALIPEVVPSSVLPGTVVYFAGTSTPDGYLLCDGSEVSRETYADLYSAIGTQYGSGDGSTTFAIPDMENYFVKSNSTPGTTASAGLPDIYGSLGGFIWGGGAFSSTGGNSSRYTGGGDNYGSNLDFYASRYNDIYGSADTVEPPSITLRACIKY